VNSRLRITDLAPKSKSQTTTQNVYWIQIYKV